MPEFAGRVDIRSILPHKDKYPAVQKAFEALKTGEKMELINDHDCSPLFMHKFPVDYPGQFDWEYLEKGPELWRVAVAKI